MRSQGEKLRFIHPYIYRCIPTYIYTCIHTYMHTYTPTYLFCIPDMSLLGVWNWFEIGLKPTYTHTYIHTCIYIYIGIHLHTYIYTGIHTYILIHMHTYDTNFLPLAAHLSPWLHVLWRFDPRLQGYIRGVRCMGRSVFFWGDQGHC